MEKSPASLVGISVHPGEAVRQGALFIVTEVIVICENQQVCRALATWINLWRLLWRLWYSFSSPSLLAPGALISTTGALVSTTGALRIGSPGDFRQTAHSTIHL